MHNNKIDKYLHKVNTQPQYTFNPFKHVLQISPYVTKINSMQYIQYYGGHLRDPRDHFQLYLLHTYQYEQKWIP